MLRVSLALCAVVLVVAGCVASSPGYAVFQTLPLAGGVGQLEILADSRLSEDEFGDIRDRGEVRAALSQATIPASDLLPAKLRLVGDDNAVVSEVGLGRSAAGVEPAPFFRDDLPVCFLTTHDSASPGTYSGTFTALFAVTRGRLDPVMARVDGGTADPLVLTDTPKSAWKIVTFYPEVTIEQVSSHPDFAHAERHAGKLPFVTEYWTYRQTGATWTARRQVRAGLWQDDMPFPASAAFS